ncbi:Acetyl-coenzyme A carboxyl transferase alpha chain [hydrothermal vent metagenome]|uniref:acetyl-CoA carboxytransferase n=1 Tax=hydrothermal vent metagenome TaxID=652676 RepID=A0A3B0T7G4_9ZZZZ
MQTYLDFEKPVADLEGKLAELRALANDDQSDAIDGEITRIETKAREALGEVYSNLTPWQKTQVARHPDRPHFSDYIAKLFDEFTPLAGDRRFAEDHAILGGPARFRGRAVMVIGQEKGSDTEARIKHNFGMARPEGYRKAVRLMEMADRFGLPIISLVDTAGAYPGIGAEQRGQSEAIARCTQMSLKVKVPFISIVIGEGGSGGAVAIATASRVLMLEHAIYTVASPEASASILWRDSTRAKDAANSMRITAQDLEGFGVVDHVIKEPLGGAHRQPVKTVLEVGKAIDEALKAFDGLDPDEIAKDRQRKYLEMGRGL